MLIPPIVIGFLGTALFGVALQHVWGWPAIFVSYGLLSVALTSIPNIVMTYVVDSYQPVAAEALLLVNGGKNTIVFGFIYGIVPWVEASGYEAVRSPPPHHTQGQETSLHCILKEIFRSFRFTLG